MRYHNIDHTDDLKADAVRSGAHIRIRTTGATGRYVGTTRAGTVWVTWAQTPDAWTANDEAKYVAMRHHFHLH